MKNVLLLLFVCSAYLGMAQGLKVDVDVVSQTANKTVLSVSIDESELQALDWQAQSTLIPKLIHGTPILRKGFPEMFRLNENIVLKGSESAIIKVLDQNYVELDGVDVPPSKGVIYRDTDPMQVEALKGEAYETAGFFPNKIVELSSTYKMSGVSGQTIWLNPIQYDPVQEILRVNTSFVIEIIDEQAQETVKPISKGQREILAKRFLNQQTLNSRYDELSEVGSMLIISPSIYMETIEDLVEWKIQKGIEVSVVDILDIGYDPSSIYDYIKDFYDNNDLAFVLLIGDENFVPTMQTDNNNACDHCYAYVDGDDHYADIFVGRFNGETEEHIRTMVDRTLEYEKNPNTEVDWMSKSIGLGSNEGPGDDDEYDYEHLNNLKIQMLDYNYNEIFECYQGSNSQASPTPGESSADLDGEPTTQSLIDHIDNGVSMINYTGHGGHTSLSTGSYDINAVDQQNNNGKYPYLIAVACCVGDFQNDFGAGPCLGDAWIRATDDATGDPTGGIGGVFSSILQSWRPPMEGQDEMMNILTENSVYPTRHTIGGVSLSGMASMIDAYEGGGIDMADTWNIFGDPSVVLRTAMPEQLVLNHAPFVSMNAGYLSVSCDVEGATIAASYDGQILGVGTVENGVLNLPIGTLTGPITFMLTGTAYNHIPYQATVEATVDAGVYIISSLDYLNDGFGNDNGLADYSEQISVDLDFANVGLTDSDVLSATVSTTSTDVTLLYGDITSIPVLAQGVNSVVTDAFGFEVNDYIEDGVTVPFLIEITDGVDVWTSSVTIELHAPVIKVNSAVEFDDSATSMPNGYFDAGESVQVNIEVANLGSSYAYNLVSLLLDDSPYVSIDEDIDITSVLANNDNTMLSFTLIADANVPLNHKVNFNLSSESGFYNDAIEFSLDVNLNIEDFEDEDYISEYVSDSPSPWYKDYTTSFSGLSSMRSGPIEDESQTDMTISINVLEPGDLRFTSKVSTEEDYDYLYFYINDFEVGKWSGEIPWSENSFPLNIGEYELRWSYQKDFTVSSGEDAVWIDDIIFPVISAPVSVAKLINDDSFKVYPNPGNGLLNIKMDGNYSIDIRDLTGRILLEFGDYEQEGQLDCTSLTKGVYILKAKNEDKEINKRIIIQ